ncbi:unnamed protein product [Effrenium voratum]|uniref:Uncharacterized protein n=1 Tax=Effrenium voratum TaxID=2562239 RepID=A0AA36IMD9_9DINO|nr:unnamed protein product [Effrenium voratum]
MEAAVGQVLGLTFLAAPAPQHGRHLTSRLSTGPEPSAGAGSFGSFGAAHAAVVCGGGLLLSAKSRPRRFGSGGSLGSLRWRSRLPVQRAEAEAKATGTKEMPKALVVNLDRSPARWESAKEEFSREGLTVERFSGTDGRALSHADLRKVATCRGAQAQPQAGAPTMEEPIPSSMFVVETTIGK